MNIKDDPLMKIFLQGKSLKPATIKKYHRSLTIYSEFLDKMPEEWITEAEEDEEKGLRMRRRKIKIYLLDFLDYLQSKDYSQLTIKAIMSNVKTFYFDFDILVPRSRSKKIVRKETIEDIPDHEDIKLALSFANKKYKAIILLMVSSGLGYSETKSLKYSHLLESLQEYTKQSEISILSVDELVNLLTKSNNELLVPTWNVTRIKTEMPYTTFSTPESLDAILDYLKLDPPHSIDEPLFRATKSKRNCLNDTGFTVYFQMLNEKCGFKKPYRQSYFRSHALRKLFATTLYTKGLPQLSIDWFLGHKINSVTESYFKTDIKSLKEQYISCIEDLSIEDTEVRVLESSDAKLLSELQVKDVKHEKDIQELKELVEMLQDQKEVQKPPKK